MDILFAMLVVSLSMPCLFQRTRSKLTVHLGLYFKLHGCYRPTTMKKTIIKRRKRVVPALREQSPTAGTHSSTGSSASPETSPRALENLVDEAPRYADNRYSQNRGTTPTLPPHRLFAPIPPPIDFTGYKSSSLLSLPHHPPSRPFESDSTGSGLQSSGSQLSRQSTSPRPTPSGMSVSNLPRDIAGRIVFGVRCNSEVANPLLSGSVKSTSPNHYKS